jgi:hypothetical protein
MCERKVQFHNLHFRVRCANGVSDSSCVSWITSLSVGSRLMTISQSRNSKQPKGRGNAAAADGDNEKMTNHKKASIFICFLLIACFIIFVSCVCASESLPSVAAGRYFIRHDANSPRSFDYFSALFRIFAAKLSPSLSLVESWECVIKQSNKYLCRCF